MLGLGANIGASPKQFSLNDIDNLKLYLKNGVGVTVGQWDDSSGEGNHAIQENVNLQATVTQGGLDFEATNPEDFYVISAIAAGEQVGFTLFIVCDLETDNGNKVIIGEGTGAENFIEFRNGNSVRIVAGGAAIQDIVPNANDSFALENGKFLMTMTRAAGGGGGLALWANGVSLPLAAPKKTTTAFNFDTLGMRNDQRFFDGIIHELAFYTKTLNDEELTDAHRHLISKHGL